MPYVITPRRLIGTLLLVDTVLICAGASLILIESGWGGSRHTAFHTLFDLNVERGFPALYSSLQLLLAAALLQTASSQARAQGQRRREWTVLALLFLFLGCDEYAALHERLNGPLDALLPSVAYLHYGWVVPYLVFVLVVGASMLPFLASLPRFLSMGMVVSGTVFVAGAVGLESLSARLAAGQLVDTLAYRLLYLSEEAMEMLAITLFVGVLAVHVSRRPPFGGIVLASSGATADAPAAARVPSHSPKRKTPAARAGFP